MGLSFLGVDLSILGRFVHWSNFHESMAILVSILVMVTIFGAALAHNGLAD